MVDSEVDAPSAVAERLAALFAKTAAERDRAGGTPHRERNALRESGLLRLSIPSELGGSGAPWPEVLETVRIIAGADGSLAHVFGFHHLMLATVRLFGSPAQWRDLASETAAKSWFWGNALNPLDPRARLTPDAAGFLLNGSKSFCSGSRDADMLIISALDPNERLVVAAIPSGRAGVVVRDDWDNIGQRQTDSGTVEFHGVKLTESELLKTPGPLGSVFASLRPCIAQLIFANVCLGLGEGALAEGKQATKLRSGFAGSGVDQASRDPYVVAKLGELWLGLESARLLCDRAAASLEAAFQRRDELTPAERGRVAIEIAAAKVATTRSGLDAASRMFELMGARATTAGAALDRYWRNLRTLTLHDPVDQKVRALGAYALSEELPVPSFYS